MAVGLRCLLVFALLFAFAWTGTAQDADKPAEIEPEVIAAADELRRTYPDDQQAIVNALRFLLRPSFQHEVLPERRGSVCVLEPFESPLREEFTVLESLRLLAVLRSGMAVTPTAEGHMQRLIAAPIPAMDAGLAEAALHMLLAVEGATRPEVARPEKFEARAAALLKAATEHADLTSTKSPHYSRDHVQPIWFANVMWRMVIFASALKLGLEIDNKLLNRDLEQLISTHRDGHGWEVKRAARGQTMIAGDLACNLSALTAISIAMTLPEDMLSRASRRGLERMESQVPVVLARMMEVHASPSWSGSRSLLALNLAPDFAPERTSALDWRDTLMRRALGAFTDAGAVRANSNFAHEIGLLPANSARATVVTAETALSAIALSGGLVPTAPGPLHGREVQSIGRIMYAQATLEASRVRHLGGDMNDRIAAAIAAGCDWLVSIQKADGSFPGANSGYAGNTAMALLSMLHGGWNRESGEIEAGVGWLEKNAEKSGRSTYSHAVVLMFFQKYYEREQAASGMFTAANPREFDAARKRVWNDLKPAHRAMIANMVDALDGAHVGGNSGGWGYTPSPNSTRADNSCSQYALLGYKAASLLGAEIGTKRLIHEAERLIRQYSVVGSHDEVEYIHKPDDREDNARSTNAVFKAKIRPGGWGYSVPGNGATMQLTAAGISSLTICMDELKVRGQLTRKLAEQIGLHIRGAESYLRHNFYKTSALEGDRGAFTRQWQRDGWGVFYNLYSVERGCVLADLRILDGEVDWYAIGSEALVDNQHVDGSWCYNEETPARRAVVNTCMAILFLKLAAMPVITDHTRREALREAEAKRKADEPSGPITGEPKQPKRD